LVVVVSLSLSLSLSLFQSVHCLSGHGSITHEIHAGEELEIAVYTRSIAGAKFTVTDVNHSHSNWVSEVVVKHTGGESLEDLPSSQSITGSKIVGPANVKVKADSLAGRFSSHNFFVVFSVSRN
jgi:hypothetical protein